jgi:hypothetical protein
MHILVYLYLIASMLTLPVQHHPPPSTLARTTSNRHTPPPPHTTIILLVSSRRSSSYSASTQHRAPTPAACNTQSNQPQFPSKPHPKQHSPHLCPFHVRRQQLRAVLQLSHAARNTAAIDFPHFPDVALMCMGLRGHDVWRLRCEVGGVRSEV